MSLLAISINDVELMSGNGRSFATHGPGIALLDPERLLLGEEARAQARLRPRRVADRYWAELSTRPLPHPTAYAATLADLAFAQLKQIWGQRADGTDEVLLVVPGTLPREALGLVLGMAEELAMPVQGLVDAAVASTTASAPGADLFHLDFFQHEALLTRMEQGHDVGRGPQRQVPEAGVSRLRAAWVAAAAEAFVKQTRFDPLHDAASEQQLYDGLDQWLASLGEEPEVTMSVTLRGEEVSAALSREAVLREATPAWRAVLAALDELRGEGRPAALGVASRGGRLTGLLEALRAADRVSVELLAPDAPLRGVLDRAASIRSPDGDVRYVTRLPALAVADVAVSLPQPDPVADEHAPTHVLLDAYAYAVGDAGLIVGTRPPAGRPAIRITGQTGGISRQHCVIRREGGQIVVEDHSRYGTFLNGERVDGRQPLAVGDLLRVGSPGRELRAIALREPEGARGQ
jgi:hypothetical protein